MVITVIGLLSTSIAQVIACSSDNYYISASHSKRCEHTTESRQMSLCIQSSSQEPQCYGCNDHSTLQLKGWLVCPLHQ